MSNELPPIPLPHRDLVERPLVARLTTSMPDGYPQTHPVWFTWEEPRHTSTSLPGCTRGGPLFRRCGAGGTARP